MDFSSESLNGLSANDFLNNQEQSKLIDLLNAGTGYLNALEIMDNTFQKPAVGMKTSNSILNVCGLTGKSLSENDWTSLAKELVARNSVVKNDQAVDSSERETKKSRFRILSKLSLLLVVFGFFMPISCNQNGFKMVEFGFRMGDSGSKASICAFLLLVLFISALISVLVSLYTYVMKGTVKTRLDLPCLATSICSGLIAFLMIIGMGDEGFRIRLQIGAYFIIAGWILSTAFLVLANNEAGIKKNIQQVGKAEIDWSFIRRKFEKMKHIALFTNWNLFFGGIILLASCVSIIAYKGVFMMLYGGVCSLIAFTLITMSFKETKRNSLIKIILIFINNFFLSFMTWDISGLTTLRGLQIDYIAFLYILLPSLLCIMGTFGLSFIKSKKIFSGLILYIAIVLLSVLSPIGIVMRCYSNYNFSDSYISVFTVFISIFAEFARNKTFCLCILSYIGQAFALIGWYKYKMLKEEK